MGHNSKDIYECIPPVYHKTGQPWAWGLSDECIWETGVNYMQLFSQEDKKRRIREKKTTHRRQNKKKTSSDVKALLEESKLEN